MINKYGHNFITGLPIDAMFRSRMRFSGTAIYLTAKLPVSKIKLVAVAIFVILKWPSLYKPLADAMFGYTLG